MLIFAWVELVYANKDDPSQLAIMALAYAAVQLVGMSLYGVDAWSQPRATRSASTSGCSPASRRCTGATAALFTRPPLGGAPPLTPVAGTVALLCTMIGTTSFDGFSQGTVWNSIVPHLQNFFADLGRAADARARGRGPDRTAAVGGHASTSTASRAYNDLLGIWPATGCCLATAAAAWR